jgi:hypothetical protein
MGAESEEPESKAGEAKSPLVSLFVVVAIGAGAFWYFDARAYGKPWASAPRIR